MASFLVTGSSRGLGLALVTELATSSLYQVRVIFATARNDESPKLKDLVRQYPGRVVYVKLDTTSDDSVTEAAKQVESILGDDGLDVLINNAGLMNWTPDGIQSMQVHLISSANDLEDTFTANVTGTHIVTRTFLPLLRKGIPRKVFNMSTTVGSFGMAERYSVFPVPAYKVAKAALNMLTVQYAQSFADEGFTFIALSPGWLQTDLGGASADLPAETGAKAVLEAIHKYGKESNGKFFNIKVAGWETREGLNQYDGASPPW